MRTMAILLGTLLLLPATAGTALAQDAPTAGQVMGQSLLGEWYEVEVWGVRAGASEIGLEGDDVYLSEVTNPFTLTVTDLASDERSFHGEWCSEHHCEDVVGALRIDGSILIVDHDGFFEGALRGEELELCYLEADHHFRIVGCRIMKRK